MKSISLKLALPLALLTSMFAATAAPEAQKQVPKVSGQFLKVYAMRFTKAMEASGQKTGAFSMSNQPEKDGFYHLNVDLHGSAPAQKLLIKYKGGVNRLQMIEAHLAKKQIYPTIPTKWSHLPICHLVASRQPDLPPTSLLVKFDKKQNGHVLYLRTSDLCLMNATQISNFPDVKDWGPYRYEIQFMAPDNGFSVTNNGQRSVGSVGKCDEASFLKLVGGMKVWFLHKEMKDLMDLYKIKENGMYFTGAPQIVQDGSIIATRNSLPLSGSNISALIYFKSVDKNGNREVLVAKAPLKFSDIAWDEVKKARVKKSPLSP